MAARAFLLTDETFQLGDTALSGSLRFIVCKAETGDEAYQAALAEADELYYEIPIGNVSGDHQGGDVWYVDVNYDPAARSEAPAGAGETPPPDPNGGSAQPPGTAGGQDPEQDVPRSWTLTTGGGTKHILMSIAEVRNVLAGPNGGTAGGAPASNGFIGQDKNGIAGVDVETSTPIIRFTDKIPRVTVGHFCKMCEMTSTTNRFPFGGFDTRELLLSAIDLNYKSGNAWERGATMKYSRSWKPFIVSDTIRFEDGKAGWELVDVRYEDVASGPFVVAKPKAAYIHQVYPDSDFEDLFL